MDQGSFPKSRNFSVIKKLFLDQGTFPQSRKSSTVTEIFHKEGSFPQKNVFLIKEIFHKQESFPQINFPQKKEVFHKQNFFLDQRSFPQTKSFLQNLVKRFSISKDQSCSLKANI